MTAQGAGEGRGMGSGSGCKVVPAARPPEAAGGTTAACPAASRRRAQPLTLAEMRSKAAFRACDRLMERGAEDEVQLWSIARVMSGPEYEQVAEERVLAGKCGNPLCTHRPPPPLSSSSAGRYRISSSDQAVYEKDGGQPLYCSPQCTEAVNRYAERLGSGALALDRFTAMYQQLKSQDRQQGQQRSSTSSTAGAAGQDTVHMAAATTAGSSAATASGSASSSAASSQDSNQDDVPGGIKSATTLVPRLAVEQVEVKAIDSCAGQFADFSRKIKSKLAGPAATAVPQAPKVKGVLKKQSQFAAGTPKTPIMLAQVKERDPSMVAAETAHNLPADDCPGKSDSSKAAAAVEGYVPRAMYSQRQRQQRRRVRWSDEVEGGGGPQQRGQQGQAAAALQEPPDLTMAARQQQQAQYAQQVQEQQQAAGQQRAAEVKQELDQQPAEEHAGRTVAAANVTVQDSSSAAPAASSSSAYSIATLASEEGPAKLLKTAAVAELPAQFECLQVAKNLTAIAASNTAAASSAAAASAAAPAAPRPMVSTSGGSSSSHIQQRDSDGGCSRGGGMWSVPPEWREAPQFYAHSPVGSSSSLAGSLASPAGSSNNLAAMAGASSPPVAGNRGTADARLSSNPPGLPRAPSCRKADRFVASSSKQRPPAAMQPDPSSNSGSGIGSGGALPTGHEQQQGQQPGVLPPSEQAALTKWHAEQLQRAFPQLSTALPPELEAALASDSEGGSDAADSENWMRSDDEEGDEVAGLASSSDDYDGLLVDGSRPNFLVQLPFFGTLFTHLEAWVTPNTVELLAAGPDVEVVLPPPSSPEVLTALCRFMATALPPVLAGLQTAAARGEVERSLNQLLHSLHLVGPLPAFKVGQWQVVAVLFLKALSLERCPALREAFETRNSISRMNCLLGALSFTSEELYTLLELLCPAD